MCRERAFEGVCLQPTPLKPLVLSELNPPLNVKLITDATGLGDLQSYFNRLKESSAKPETGWDIETTPLKDYYFRRARTFQFGNHKEQYVIDLLPFCDNDPELLFSCQGDYGKNLPPRMRELMNDSLAPVLCTNDFLKVGVSLGFEYQNHYWNFGLRTWNFYDCAIAEKCIWAGAAPLKRYAYFSMEQMVSRYFGIQIDKTEQTSFTLDGELRQTQIDYGGLDTRFPLSIKAVQKIIADGKHLHEMGPNTRKYFENLEPKQAGTGEPIILGDNLNEIIQIENDAIGFFEDMHIHGERLDREKWRGNVAKARENLRKLITDKLDPIFLPIVGSKHEMATDAEIESAERLWKSYNIISDAEIALKGERRTSVRSGDTVRTAQIDAELSERETKRKADKEIYKTAHSDMKKKRTKIRNLAAKCEGEALINYGSNAQLLAVIQGMKGLKNVTSLDDEVLEKYADQGFLVMSAIRDLHEYTKQIGTYGDQWATEWATKPCKEEGWLNPGDGRLHCVYNQYDAETGRSSSEKPNGQNLPQDKDVRSCFVADPPNESIRVSNCCDADTYWQACTDDSIFENPEGWYCKKCEKPCDTHAEEYAIITADMSGAELRIIAELANDPIWIGAFNRGEDVHSVGTELLYEEEWPKGALPDCAYFKLKEDGEPQRKQCKCPEHKKLRGDTKSINFLLAYGGGPSTLAKRIKKKMEKAQELMALHSSKFPQIWAYLDKSGKDARMKMRSFDMFGRRRLFPDPIWERAKERVLEDKEEELRLSELESADKIRLFEEYHLRKPLPDELFILTHREPTSKEIGKAFGAMQGAIERQGKNHAVQGTNASIAKIAGGCGFDLDGKPFLWHIIPKYRAKVIKFVHDELVFQSPKHHAVKVGEEVESAFKRAAAKKMTQVVMESEHSIDSFWKK